MADKIVQLIDKDGDNVYPVSVAYGFPTISPNVLETIGDITTDNTIYTVQNTGFLVGIFTCPPGNGGSSKVQIDDNGTWTSIITSGWLVASSDNRIANSFCIPVKKGTKLRFVIGTNMPISGVKILKNNMYPASATHFTILDCYPVGSYYETSDTTFDPNIAWGGTWVEDTAGRVLVAVNTGTFSTVGGTGGEETHTLTIAEMPKHHHTIVPQANYSGSLSARHTTSWEKCSSTSQNTSDTGGDGAHNNLQPYTVVKRWHRTA